MAAAKNKNTPATDTIEDVWLNAINELPDSESLVKLLRNYSVELPPGIRDLFAEMLKPGKPDIVGGRLIWKPNDTFRQITGSQVDGDAGLLSLVAEHYAEVDRRKQFGGKGPSRGAATTAAKRSKRTERTIYRKLKHWKAIVARLREH